MYWRHRSLAPRLGAADLEHRREIELVSSYQSRGDRQARDELILSHLRLVRRFARYFSRHGSTFDDLCQEGCLALLRAAVTFAPERGVRFATYAAYWIRARMQREVAQSRAHWYTAPASHAYVTSVDKIDDAKQLLRLTLSLDAVVNEDFDASFESVVPSDAPSVELQVADREMHRWLGQTLVDLVEKNGDRRVAAICARRLLRDDPATLEQLGAQLKLSREGVRQLELRLVEQMRQSLIASSAA